MVNDTNLVNAANNQKEGWVYIIDQRSPPPQGEVPPYDIIGAFEVMEARLGEFKPNSKYQIKSPNGLADLTNIVLSHA